LKANPPCIFLSFSHSSEHKFWLNRYFILLAIMVLSATSFIFCSPVLPDNSSTEELLTVLSFDEDEAESTANFTAKDSLNKASEIEGELARKAESGRNTELNNDRFYTYLFYFLSFGSIILVIVIIYFFINLNDKGKRIKLLKKRIEKLSLKKKREEV